MDPNILVRVLNHHGQQLTHAIENYQGTDSIIPAVRKELNYHQYHSRAKDFKFEDRIKRQKLYEFIAKKSSLLFEPLSTQELPYPISQDTDYWAEMPPLESHMYVPLVDRKKYFFETVRVGDLLIGKLQSFNVKGANVAILTTDGGKKRYINDLSIKAFCPVGLFPQSVAGVEKINEYVRGRVVKVDPTLEKLVITMKGDVPQNKLGVINEEDLPQFYRVMLANEGVGYQTLLSKMRSFRNPSCDKSISHTLGLSHWRISSFIHSFNDFQYPADEYAEPVRKLQNKNWAYRSVKEGVSYFKQGKQTEALQCLNQALHIDSENVEAYVARGALLANNSSFKKAIEDFEKALNINPLHANGRKYLTETLVALGKSLQEKGSLEEAVSVYKSALCSNPDSYEAKLALKQLDTLMTKKILDKKRSPPPRTSDSKVKRPEKERHRSSSSRSEKRRRRSSAGSSPASSVSKKHSPSPRSDKKENPVCTSNLNKASTKDLFKTRQRLKDLLKKESRVSLPKKKRKSPSPKKNHQQRDSSYEQELEAELEGKTHSPSSSPSSLKERLERFYQKAKHRGLSSKSSSPSSEGEIKSPPHKEIPLLDSSSSAKFSFKMNEKPAAAAAIKKWPFSSSDSDKDEKVSPKSKKSRASSSSSSSPSSSSSSSSHHSKHSRRKRRKDSPPSARYHSRSAPRGHNNSQLSHKRHAEDYYHRYRYPPSSRRYSRSPSSKSQRSAPYRSSYHRTAPPKQRTTQKSFPNSKSEARAMFHAVASKVNKIFAECPSSPPKKTQNVPKSTEPKAFPQKPTLPELDRESNSPSPPKKNTSVLSGPKKPTLQEMESFLDVLREKKSKAVEEKPNTSTA